jgi:hypothetical protein
MVTRRPSIGRVDWATLPVHPLGAAAFPVVFLFAENAADQLTLVPLWGPLGLALLGASAAFVLCAALLRDPLRGALLASLLVAMFFSFGHAAILVGEAVPLRFVAGGYAAVGLAAIYLIWRGGRWVRPATTFLNLAMVVLVGFNALRIGQSVAEQSANAGEAAPTPAVRVDASAPKRDIYYVILDRYANAETLREVYGFDNRPFLDALEQRGFAIAEDAWANYWKTAFSVMASMSMDYLDTDRFDLTEPPNFAPLHAALQDHLPVPVTLKSLGYEYIHLGNYWEPTGTNVDADVSLRYEDATEFDDALRSTTALVLLSPPTARDDDPETAPYGELARGTTFYTFARMEEVVGRSGPQFVFAHLLLPHPPYVFDTDGSLPSRREANSRPEEEQYVRQLQWANSRVLQLVDRLTDVPPGEEPIIILQADEGPWPPGFRDRPRFFQWLDATRRDVQQKFGILNAFYLPGVDAAAAGVNDRTSPVNEFRIVFNAYFDAGLPLLPDVTYLSPDYARMYDFVEYPRE